MPDLSPWIELPGSFFLSLFLYKLGCALFGIRGMPWATVSITINNTRSEDDDA